MNARSLLAGWIAVHFFSLGTVSSARAAEPDCQEFASVRQAQLRQPAQDATVRLWADYQSRVWDAWKSAAKEVFSRYLAGMLTQDELENCVKADADRETLGNVLPQIFFEESLRKLAQSQNASIQTLLRMLDAKTSGNHLVLFRLVGHFKEATPPTNSLGGVQRGTGSIFMNFLRIDPNEWLVILCHELLHSLDQRLASAIELYANPTLTSELAQKAAIFSDPASLPGDLRLQMDLWLGAGLDRGFLAEYRAWTVTLALYRAGLMDGIWSRIPWLDSILALAKPGQSLNSLTLNYLDPAFVDPAEGIFSLPLVSEELTSVRSGIRASDPPPLDNLAAILSPPASD